MRRRRTRDETRELLLDAAVRVIAARTAESGTSTMNPLAAVRITDSLEVLNAELQKTDPTSPRVTSGAAYNIWPSQAAFQQALLDRVLAAAAVPEIDRISAEVDRGLHAGLPWQDVVAACFGLDLDVSFATPTMFTMIGITALSPVDQVRTASATPNERYEREVSTILRRILRHADRRVRPGRSMRDLVWAIEALEVGYLLRRRTPRSPAAPPAAGPSSSRRSLHWSKHSPNRADKRLRKPRVRLAHRRPIGAPCGDIHCSDGSAE